MPDFSEFGVELEHVGGPDEGGGREDDDNAHCTLLNIIMSSHCFTPPSPLTSAPGESVHRGTQDRAGGRGRQGQTTGHVCVYRRFKMLQELKRLCCVKRRLKMGWSQHREGRLRRTVSCLIVTCPLQESGLARWRRSTRCPTPFA